MMLRRLAVACLLSLACLCNLLQGAEIYVSPSGSDRNPGTREQPLQSLAAAQRAARVAAKEARAAMQVWFLQGTYPLAETIVFGPEDSGTAEQPVVYAAAPGEEVVISGGTEVRLEWKPYRDHIMQAKTADDFDTDQLFVDGKLQQMARYPNFNPAAAYWDGYAADAISPARVARWADPAGGFIHASHGAMWGSLHFRITGKDKDGKLLYEGGWQNNRPTGMHGEYRFVENIFEELDAPGEWFLDHKSHTLYFYPPEGLDLAHATVEGVRLKHLIEFHGTQQRPVRFVLLKGLTIEHAARTFMDTREPLLRSDWRIYRGGAVLFTGCEDCSLQDCTLTQLGGNAVFLSNYNRRVNLRGCHIHEIGASGVAFVGDRAAVREPVDDYGRGHDWQAMDKTPGPKTDNYPAQCAVEDCLIYRIGRIEKQAAGVEISMSSGIVVRHCSIYDTPRAGINIGDGCWGGDIVEYCDVFDTVRETGDHGSFNSWGRDRNWDAAHPPAEKTAVDDNQPRKHFVFLDAIAPVILRNNRWRCDHGWDIDLDDGSSNFEIYNNLCLHGGLKNREGYGRIVLNNIIVGNSFHPHVWYAHSGDVFAHNIVMTAYQPIGMPPVWGKKVDENLLPNADTLKQEQSAGRDLHSIAGDPMFVDAATGDFRVKPDSPALKIGFKNFAMGEFGVQSPELRSLARQPQIGNARQENVTPETPRVWLGARIKSVQTLGEMSATGLPRIEGALVVEAPDSSEAAKAGLRRMDVVLKCGEKTVGSAAELEQLWHAMPHGQPVILEVFRDQRLAKISVPAIKNPGQ
jgi:hypothetical protein